MALPWGLVVILIGLVYGLVAPGRQGKMRLLVNGLLMGIVLGLVFAVLGYTLDANPLGFGTDLVSFVWAFFVLTVLFTLGVWIGDLIEAAARRRPA